MPDYRVVGAFPLAYAIIVSGSLVHNKRLRLRTDLSYGVYIYAFPMQQLLIVCGLRFLKPLVFFPVATLATLPMAALSWFLVEKPALSLKSRLLRKSPVPAQSAAIERPPEMADPEDDHDAPESADQHALTVSSAASVLVLCPSSEKVATRPIGTATMARRGAIGRAR